MQQVDWLLHQSHVARSVGRNLIGGSAWQLQELLDGLAGFSHQPLDDADNTP